MAEVMKETKVIPFPHKMGRVQLLVCSVGQPPTWQATVSMCVLTGQAVCGVTAWVVVEVCGALQQTWNMKMKKQIPLVLLLIEQHIYSLCGLQSGMNLIQRLLQMPICRRDMNLQSKMYFK